MTPPPVAAVSGASGYLGSKICTTLESKGWQVLRLVRTPDPTDSLSRQFDLGDPLKADTLSSVDVLVHAAYDLSVTRRADIWRINVGGTRRLLTAAHDAGVRRIIVLSSMSAFEGTSQLYGRAKLEIEEITSGFGGCSIRPGLVYGDRPGGMAGALRKITRLPIIPLPASGAHQYPLHEDDLMSVIAALSAVDDLPSGPIGVAPNSPVTFRDLLCYFAAQEGRRCRFVPVPWRFVYWGLRTAELARVPVPFRADSLLGLARSAPFVPGQTELAHLGVTIRPFPPKPNFHALTRPS
jgi:nucleoside-diphosphate-sugar epimerase